MVKILKKEWRNPHVRIERLASCTIQKHHDNFATTSRSRWFVVVLFLLFQRGMCGVYELLKKCQGYAFESRDEGLSVVFISIRKRLKL